MANSVFGKEQAKAQNSEVFFGQIRNVKTIKHPDGTIETHRTIKDNEGNEEVTVCHKIEDKEYCIIKKKR
ncbi:hypothetical protein NQ318_008885 [Aromia moschata]|uniref:Uncharacterized protein n=1 Tax=Aromia moschata TaxID=1265417 RepID=A0AAV8ZAC8_9CUCU|nr:hypothetical protein NQ318_008885 [Aromia moschata]